MYSTSKGPSLSERRSQLPCMRWALWPLWGIQQLRVVLAIVLLPVAEQWGQSEQWRWDRPQRKAALVESRFVCVVHA